MCGICGYLSKNKIEKKILKKMNDTMLHRGPNDSGEEVFSISDSYYLGFAQRRLSIMDVTSNGHQPMFSNDKSLMITFNGEIYNFKELRNSLEYEFKTNCDTEVILASYLKWGADCLKYFNGMFAFAIYDFRNNSLFIARDRIGKKPLYYYLSEESMVFASELKPILACPFVEKKINVSVLGQYFTNQYINAPYSILENVYKLEPGSYILFNNCNEAGCKNGVIKKYWAVANSYRSNITKTVKNYNAAKKELKDFLVGSVKKRLQSDVPLGVLLSGGYDSVLTAAIAQSLSSKPVKTFTIGFDDQKYNEAPYAKEIAEFLGTEHTDLYITEKELFDQVKNLPLYFDEPMADSSQIPTMLVSKLAASKVTVALSGDGGDEFFCGYEIYDVLGKFQKIDTVAGLIHWILNLPLIKKLNVENKLPINIQTVLKSRNPSTKTQMRYYAETVSKKMIPQKLECHFPIEEQYRVGNLVKKRMLLDMDTYLPGDILCKSDRASMKYSLELRCPLLDVDVMEYSFRLPHRFKCSNGIKKRILKDITYDFVPKALLDRPKHGFGAPFDKWLRNELRSELESYVDSEFLKKQMIFDSEFVISYVEHFLKAIEKDDYQDRREAEIVWSYFVFQKWYKEVFMKNLIEG